MEPTEEEIEAMAEEFRDVCRKTPSNAMDTLARHVLSRSAPPGTIRLGTGLTEAQRAMGKDMMLHCATKYAEAATALHNIEWYITPEGHGFWQAIYDHFRQIAADLRSAAEPPVDPRIEVVKAKLALHRIAASDTAVSAILAALDKMGGAGG